jgi:hypothetical protein
MEQPVDDAILETVDLTGMSIPAIVDAVVADSFTVRTRLQHLQNHGYITTTDDQICHTRLGREYLEGK